VSSFVAHFSDPVAAFDTLEHLRRLGIAASSAGEPYSVAGHMRPWETRVVIDTVARYGGKVTALKPAE
jgi:hypothetical protein